MGQIIPNPEKNEQINTMIQTTTTMMTNDELGSSSTYELPKQVAFARLIVKRALHLAAIILH